MWQALRPHMIKAGLDPVRVENPALPGTPDVNFKEGWFELKHADRWPVRGGPLRLKHPPTPQQKIWLLRRWQAGGFACLLLRVGQEWFAFAGEDVRVVWVAGVDAPMEAAVRRYALIKFDNPFAVASWASTFKRTS